MGVPFLYAKLIQKFNLEHKELKSDTLYFDYNSMIYKCCKDYYNENDIIRTCITITNSLLEKFKFKNVFLMMDGVAPLSKMRQQRERRYRSMYDEKNWDTNLISPETSFMTKLSNELKNYYRNSKYNMYISDTSEVGEGEQKIIKSINKPCYVYGLDADLILLSLLKNEEIVLLREKDDIIEMLNINVLKEAIYKEFKIHDEKQEDIIRDFVFLASIFGNDFIPTLPNISLEKNFDGINVLEQCYKNTLSSCGHITNGIDINYTNFYTFLNHLSKYKNISRKNVVFRDEIKEEIKVINEDYVKFDKPGYENRYYNYYKISNIKQSCYEYIKTLTWIYQYYNNNTHVHYNWMYPYESTPLVSDLIKYNFSNFTFEKSLPLSSKEQLFYILPSKSLEKTLNDSEMVIFNQFKNTKDYIKYFPKTIIFNIFGVEWLWRAKVIIEPMNYNLYNFLFC